MSGFVAAACNREFPGLQTSLVQMSQVMAYRGDQKDPQAFSSHAAAVVRYREKSGYRVDSHANNRYGIVLDGLVFNRHELINALGADSSTDIAQVILDGFERFGDSWFARIDGSFAVMIVDLQSNEVIVARDRFAHRPLYFGRHNGCVWVANEIKAILAAPEFPREINDDNIYSSIGYGMTPGPQTLIKGVYKCVPGFVFRIKPEDTTSPYHANDYLILSLQSRLNLQLADAKEFILTSLEKHVGQYLDACPDLGVLLSGGVDSALIAHLAGKLGNYRNPSICFGATEWDSDESEDAKQMARNIGLDFVRTDTSSNDDLLGSLQRVINELEDPTRFENALALELGSQSAIGKCTALMTGEGADYILGEREHAVANRLTKFLRIPAPVRAMIGALPLQHIPLQFARGLAPYMRWKSVRDYGQRASANCCDLITGGSNVPPENEIVDMLADVTSDWPVGAQYSFMVLREAGHCWIERMEKISAAAGMESFHPFENNEMFQFGLELPDQLRFANNISKPAVRSIAADLFGNEVAYRQKKQLAAPMQLWLNKSKQLNDAVLKLKRSDSRIRAYLHQPTVDKYLSAYEREGAQSESIAVPLFRMLAFEVWLETFL
jgi:asparagine synthase (glutamine-hydrolysing)